MLIRISDVPPQWRPLKRCTDCRRIQYTLHTLPTVGSSPVCCLLAKATISELAVGTLGVLHTHTHSHKHTHTALHICGSQIRFCVSPQIRGQDNGYNEFIIRLHYAFSPIVLSLLARHNRRRHKLTYAPPPCLPDCPSHLWHCKCPARPAANPPFMMRIHNAKAKPVGQRIMHR